MAFTTIGGRLPAAAGRLTAARPASSRTRLAQPSAPAAGRDRSALRIACALPRQRGWLRRRRVRAEQAAGEGTSATAQPPPAGGVAAELHSSNESEANGNGAGHGHAHDENAEEMVLAGIHSHSHGAPKVGQEDGGNRLMRSLTAVYGFLGVLELASLLRDSISVVVSAWALMARAQRAAPRGLACPPCVAAALSSADPEP